jgi:small conductance mechanosensitive channel
MENIDAYTAKLIELVIIYAPKVVLAIVTLVLGLWVIRFATKGVRKSMEKTKVDKTLIPFISNLISWGLKALLL